MPLVYQSNLLAALDNGIPITNPAYYGSKASDEELADIFKSDTKESAPMLSERIRVMREAGQVLCEKFDGSFINCINQADHSASKLLDIIIEKFPCFKDVHDFHGRKGITR
jgi:GTP1/Obg family GTP-binding protein